MRLSYEIKTRHRRNDGKPLFLSFYEAMIYSGLDRTMLEFILLYHIRVTRAEMRHLALETLDHARRFASLYPQGPPPRLADITSFSHHRTRLPKRLLHQPGQPPT